MRLVLIVVVVVAAPGLALWWDYRRYVARLKAATTTVQVLQVYCDYMRRGRS